MNDPHIRVPKTRAVRIHQEGAEVVLLLDGQVAFQAHWRYVKELGEGLLNRARAAEQFEAIAKGRPVPAPAKRSLRSILGIPFFGKKT